MLLQISEFFRRLSSHTDVRKYAKISFSHWNFQVIYIYISDKIVIVLSNLPARYRSTIKIDGSLLMEVEGRSLGWYIRIRGVRIETKQIKWRANNTIGQGMSHSYIIK